MMELWIYDPSLTHIGILDTYDTLIFDFAYADIAKLNVFANYSDDLHALFAEGNYLSKPPQDEDAEQELFCIHSVQMKETAKGNTTIEVKCSSLLALMKQRILRQDITQSMALKAAFTTVFNHCFRGGDQDTPNLELRLDMEYTDAVELADLQGKELLQVLQSLCSLKKLGLRVLSDIKQKIHYLNIYEGIDRSVEGENCYVVSDEYDNIFAPDFLRSQEQMKNAAYCINEKKLYTVGTAKGLERREVLLNNNISKTYTDASGQTVTRTDAEVKRLIEQELWKELEKHKMQETFKCSVLVHDYGKIYGLGDLVRFEHRGWNIVQAMRISSCKESWTNKGQKLELGLGDKQASLIDKIKLLG